MGRLGLLSLALDGIQLDLSLSLQGTGRIEPVLFVSDLLHPGLFTPLQSLIKLNLILLLLKSTHPEFTLSALDSVGSELVVPIRSFG